MGTMLLKATYVFQLMITLPSVALSIQYIYVPEKKTLLEAHEFCTNNGSTLSDNVTIAIQECGVECVGEDIWTSIFAAPYLSILGCFKLSQHLNFVNLSHTSVVDCQQECNNATAFAISDKQCACIDDVLDVGGTVNAKTCNIMCEGLYCGGMDVMNVYITVEEDFFEQRPLLKGTADVLSCLTYQCVNGSQVFTETDCTSAEKTDAACSTFFSCTFEPGEPCFFFQSEMDSLNWTITNHKTEFGPERAYQGSYFAYVNNSDKTAPLNKTATLKSNVKINGQHGALWCLRFRYQLPDKNTGTVLKVIIQSKQNTIISKELFNFGKFKEWNYTDLQFNVSHVKEATILFEFTSGIEATIALDDMTLTQGPCGDTLIKVLMMTGRLRCGFEGNQSVCFNQSVNDNFDWTITGKNGTDTKDTGPSEKKDGNYFSFIEASGEKRRNGHKAILISKFVLNDVNVTYSMWYHMYGADIGELKVYLIELDTCKEKEKLFEKKGDQGNNWKPFNRTDTITGSRYLCISAKIKKEDKGDIAIDDIRLEINEPDSNGTWQSSSERCVRKVGSYPIPHTQLGNTRCMSSEKTKRWTGIVRPQQRLKGNFLKEIGRNPSDVLVYNSSNKTFSWEKFNSSSKKTFFCESEKQENYTSFDPNTSTASQSNDKNEHEKTTLFDASQSPDTEKQENYTSFDPNTSTASQSNDKNGTTVIGVLVGLSILVLCILAVIIIKRKKIFKNRQRSENAGVTNVIYEQVHEDDVIGSEDKRVKINVGHQRNAENNVDRNKPEQKPSDSNNFANREQVTEGEYNHLTLKTNHVMAPERNVYSHVTDNQYGLHPIQKPEDNTYDHSAGLLNDGDYGTPGVVDSPDLYDHASGTYSSLHRGADVTSRNISEDSNPYDHAADTLYSSANQSIQH